MTQSGPEVSKAKTEEKSKVKLEVESKNILSSQDSDIHEGHILLRIPSQTSLPDRLESDRKSKSKVDKTPIQKLEKKKDPGSETQLWKSHLIRSSDEEIFEEQKGNFHKNLEYDWSYDISKFFEFSWFYWPLIIIENFCIDQRHDAKSDDRIIDLYSGKHLSRNVTYMKERHLTIWKRLPVGQHKIDLKWPFRLTLIKVQCWLGKSKNRSV